MRLDAGYKGRTRMGEAMALECKDISLKRRGLCQALQGRTVADTCKAGKTVSNVRMDQGVSEQGSEEAEAIPV